MVEGADIDNGISVEISMASGIGAAMVDSEPGFGVVEMLYARANCLYSSFVLLHPERSCRANCSDAIVSAKLLVLAPCLMRG